MTDHNRLEESTEFLADFDKLGKIAAGGEKVIPAIVQDETTKEVLMMGYMNREALSHTLREKVLTFWSTSRREIWVKGLTSGNTFTAVSVKINCEQNSFLITVRKNAEGICHTKDKNGTHRKTCYYREILPKETLKFTQD